MRRTAYEVHRLTFLGAAGLIMALALLGAKLDAAAQLSALVIGVAILGIPHGAIDPLLARVFGVTRTAAQTILFVIAYLAVAGLVVGFWLLAPPLALGTFLAFSIWHFRGDWAQEISSGEASIAAAIVVCAPALFHPEETNELFAMLTFGGDGQWIVSTAQVVGGIGIVALAGIAVARIRQHRLVVLELLSLSLLAWLLPPLLFFAVYFCGLHSPRHLIESGRILRWRSPAVRLTALGVSLATVAMAVAVYVSLPAIDATPRLLAVIFVGLAALTVPHMLLLEVVANRRVRAAP